MNKYICIKTFSLTGLGVLFTIGKVYKSEYKNCLTSNTGCIRTIVMNNPGFNFDEYFEKI